LSAGTAHNLLIDALPDAVSFDVDTVDYYGSGRSPEAPFGRTLVRSRWQSAPIPDSDCEKSPADWTATSLDRQAEGAVPR